MALTEKAFLEIEGTSATIPCMFNPAELTVSRSNNWSGDSLAGQGVPQVVYKGAQSGSMSLNLTFDTADTGQAVTVHTGKMLGLMDVDPTLPGSDADSNNARPPYVIFHWGSLHSFKAVVSSLNLQFTYFSSTGVPLRAKVALTLTQYAESKAFGPQNPTSGTPHPAPGAPDPAGRDARSHCRPVLRRFHQVAADRHRERHRRPAGAAGRIAAQRAKDDQMTAPVIAGLVAPVIKVDGAELAANVLNQLIGLRIERTFRLPARCVLEFDDTGFALSGGVTFAVGTTVAVITTDNTELMSGEVTGLDLDFQHGTPLLAVQIDDPSYRMTLGTKVRTFTAMTYSEVVTSIAQEYGLTPSVEHTDTRFDYLLQSDSDFGFVDEMADRTGFDWCVEGSKLIFAQPRTDEPVQTLELGKDLVRFSVRASALHPGAATVRGWSEKLKQEVMSTPSTATTPLPTSQAFQSHITPSALKGMSAVVTTAGRPQDADEADSLAASWSTRWKVGAVSARGTCAASPKIVPGAGVAITNVGPANGTYYVTAVRHTYTGTRGFETHFTAGDRAPSGLVDTLRAPDTAGGSSFRQDNLVIGVVTAFGTQSKQLGRVKVKYPALGDIESNWARVVTVGGGSKRGMTFLPEVNDEVLVAFEGGDVRRPLVLGGLFNGVDLAEEFGSDAKTGKIERRRITSRLGHYVEMSDGQNPADQHIALMLHTGQHSVRLGKDELVASVPAGTPVSIVAGTAKFEITADGSITIAGKKITIKAETDVEIQGLNVTTKASIKAATSATNAEITATGTAKVTATGPLQLKGTPAMIN